MKTVINTEVRETTNTGYKNTLLNAEDYFSLLCGERLQRNIKKEELTSVAIAWQDTKCEKTKEELFTVFYTAITPYVVRILKNKLSTKEYSVGRVDKELLLSHALHWGALKGLRWYKRENTDNVFMTVSYAVTTGFCRMVAHETTAKQLGLSGVMSLDGLVSNKGENSNSFDFIASEEKKLDSITLEMSKEQGEETLYLSDIADTSLITSALNVVRTELGEDVYYAMLGQGLNYSERPAYYVEKLGHLGYKEYNNALKKKVSRLFKKAKEFCATHKELLHTM